MQLIIFLISNLVYKTSEKNDTCLHNRLEGKVTSSNALFFVPKTKTYLIYYDVKQGKTKNELGTTKYLVFP